MKLEKKYQAVLALIKASLWGDSIPNGINREVFEEMDKHILTAFPYQILPRIDLDIDLRKDWQTINYKIITRNAKCMYAQRTLPVTVPYVILKGTEAAKYYPEPNCRALGDIDLITSHEDFDTAFRQLLEGGYKLINDEGREAVFLKNKVIIELHRSFAKLSNPEYAEYLDNIIIKNINQSHVMPDDINGLVLLEHISQHLVNGLGLRQIIDWMMFVDRCLPDTRWPEFCIMTQNIGLEKLAVVTTRMCEIYLGLTHREWCSGAEEALCDSLMMYLLNCGNFGNKRTSDRDNSESVFVYARGPIELLRLLQERGICNWKAAHNYPVLIPFAWIYQAGRYLKRGISQKNAGREIKAAYLESRKKIELFDALGVRQDSKGIAVYKDGRYILE